MKLSWKKQAGISSVYVLSMVVALVLVLVFNIFMGMLSDRYPLTIDLTQEQVFEINDETIAYLNELNEPIDIMVLATQERFESTSIYNAQASKIFKQFAMLGNDITLSYVDYIKNPTLSAQYPEFTLKHGDVIIKSNLRAWHIKTEELFRYSYNSDDEMIISSSRAEEAILTGIVYATSESFANIVFIQGHGEMDTTVLQEFLKANHYAVSTVNLLTTPLPEDSDAIFLVSPMVDFTHEEISIIDEFLLDDGCYGKTLLYCASPQQAELPVLQAYLQEWGISVDDGLVFETDATRVYSQQPFYAIADVNSEHALRWMPAGESPMLIPVSRPISVRFAQQETYYTDVLFQFGEDSGVKPSDAPENFVADDTKHWGPMPALIMGAKRNVNIGETTDALAQSQIIASGSAEMLADYVLMTPSFANREFLMTMLGELTGQSSGIQLMPKQITSHSLNLTKQSADLLGIVFVAIIPILTLLIGIVIWLTRRHK